MKKYIHIQKADREFISKALKVTERTIFNATHFEDINEGNDLMKKIRMLALQRGGIVMVKAEEAEILYDADGYMRWHLPNDVLLEFCYKEENCVVFHKGTEVKRYNHVMVSEIPSIHNWASALR